MIVFCFNDTATTEIYTYCTLFPYTTLFRSEDRAGRCGGRVPRPCLDHHLGALPGSREREPAARRRLGAHLDHHAVDYSRQPRRELGRASCRERVCQYV